MSHASIVVPKPDEPPLHRAARLGLHDDIRSLVSAGADIHQVFNMQPDPDARDFMATPLMVAAGSGEGATVETVKLLIELGADATALVDKNSAAEFACEGLGWHYKPGGDAQRLRLLLEAGSPLPKSPKWRNRLLCKVAEMGDPQRLALLLNHGISAAGHWDPEYARKQHLEMQDRMQEFRKSEPDLLAGMPDEFRERFAQIQKENDQKMFEQQCSAPAGFEIPLFCAAGSGSAECVRALLKAGADVTVRDSSQRTAIYKAASTEAARLLLESGLSLEVSDCYGWDPLVSALSDGEEGVPRVRALLECGADVNATHDNGYTVFMSAVGSNRHPELLRLLVAAGADPHAVSDFGYNAFHAAIDVNGEANEVESVRSTFRYLDHLGVNLEHRTKGGQTPLARAIHSGTATEVRELCAVGADPNAVCPFRQCGEEECEERDLPLLFHAFGHGVHKDQKILALLEAGADPLAKDNDGHSALSLAVGKLVHDSDQFEGLFKAFYEGHRDLLRRRETATPPLTRQEYIESEKAAVHQYVEQFAAAIPVRDEGPYSEEWRLENIETIAWLALFDRWAQIEAWRKRS